MPANHVSDKVKPLNELAEIIGQARQAGEKIVLCHGVFDLLHPGHIHHLEAAKREGTVLVVTVTPDVYVNKGPGRPVFNQNLRVSSIAAIECVDWVAISQSPTAVEIIQLLQPDVYVKGREYQRPEDDLTSMIVEEARAVQAVGGRLHFTDDEVVFSSTRLLNEHFAVYPPQARAFLSDFRQRYLAAEVIRRLKAVRPLKVLVVGDAIIDEYCYCRALGRSAKDVFMVTQFLREEIFAGGALAAANHIAGFCDEVHLATVLGEQDSREAFVRHQLKPNVRPHLFFRPDAPTTVKRRFVEPAFLRKMFEVCMLNDSPLPDSTAAEVSGYLAGALGDIDVVVVTDFGHGLLSSNALVQLLSERARFLAVNTQTNSANTGYNLVTRYPRADYVCIDEPELRLATHNRFLDLTPLILDISQRLQCSHIAITRGHHGAMTYDAQGEFTSIPVFSEEVLDTMGAGDAFLAVTALCVATGCPMDMVGFIGNAVGALAVKIVGNRSPVEPVALLKFISSLLK